MPSRLPACEPCRRSKLACDHLQPVCSRCQATNARTVCTYRKRPFKKIRKAATTNSDLSTSHSVNKIERDPNQTSAKYPNPGYLGPSSYVTIFEQLPSSEGTDVNCTSTTSKSASSMLGRTSLSDATISRGARLLEQVYGSLRIPSCKSLVELWLAKGLNLSLAGSFVQRCAHSVDTLFRALTRLPDEFERHSRRLFIMSSQSLTTCGVSTTEDLCANFCVDSVRWETLGLFLTAVSRAAVDLDSFADLYVTKQEQRELQMVTVEFSDRCVDLALSLDCMNDLQLILQYENFINHSLVHGDQSYHSWRRLGDVISSLFALGYHEQVESDAKTTAYIKNMRRAAFARTYSAEINISIFLGRPSRMRRKHCRFQLPDVKRGPDIEEVNVQLLEEFDYAVDTRWSAKCAMLKEDAVALLHETNADKKHLRVSSITIEAEANWADLPPQARLEGPLKLCHRAPTERDLLVSTRLHHLHVLFLLELASTQRISEPAAPLMRVAAGMLQLVAQATMLREHLVNSGTGLVWKVAYFGLPAAGIICLSLLNRQRIAWPDDILISQLFQDLSVLTAQIEAGVLVHVQDPNYALLSGATRTIKVILNQILGQVESSTNSDSSIQDLRLALDDQNAETDWNPWDPQEMLDFEEDFWISLAEHPTLAVSEM